MAPKIEILCDPELATPYKSYATRLWENTSGTANRFFPPNIILQVRNVGGKGVIRFLTLDSGGGLAFLPRSGVLKDTPFWYGSNEEVSYVPGIEGTGWLPHGDGTFGHIPFLRNEVWPLTSNNSGGAGASHEGTDQVVETGALFSKSKDSVSFLGPKTNYGNFYWASKDGAQVVSWDGPPTRHFRDDFKEYYETFTSKIYIKGAIVDAPFYPDDSGEEITPRVLGASLPGGVLYMVGYHRLTPVQIIVSRYSFTDQEWTPLGSIPAGYNGLAWLPSIDGKSFYRSDGAAVEINKVTDVETGEVRDELTYLPWVGHDPNYEDGGLQTEDSNLTFTKNVSGEQFFEPPPENSTSARRALSVFSQHVTTTNNSDGDGTVETVPVTKSSFRSAELPYISVSMAGDRLAVGDSLSLENIKFSYCKIKWSVGSCEFEGQDTSNIVITAVNGCGTLTVTATAQGGGNDGLSVSKDVLLPSGRWVLTSENVPGYRTWYLASEVETDSSKRVSYYMRDGGFEYSPDYYRCTCKPTPYTSYGDGTHVGCNSSICGHTPTTPGPDTLPGRVWSYSFNDYFCMPSPYGAQNCTQYLGWYKFKLDPQYYRIYSWVC